MMSYSKWNIFASLSACVSRQASTPGLVGVLINLNGSLLFVSAAAGVKLHFIWISLLTFQLLLCSLSFHISHSRLIKIKRLTQYLRRVNFLCCNTSPIFVYNAFNTTVQLPLKYGDTVHLCKKRVFLPEFSKCIVISGENHSRH